MDFASGPQVVGDECEEKNVGKRAVDRILTVEKSDRQTSDGGDEKGRTGQQDVTFVSRRIGAGAECEVDERAEKEHVRQRNNVKHLRVAAGDVVRAEQIVRAGHNAENKHGLPRWMPFFFSDCDVVWKSVPSTQELRGIVKCSGVPFNRVISMGLRVEGT